jgi:hypothetical protein
MTGFAPIVVFGYNRPDHLRQTLEYLARAEGAIQSELWIFCDGPKPGAEPALVRAVRKVARDTVWTERFRAVRIEVSDINKGLAKSIIGGVTQVMEAAGRAIVVEDDLLVAPDFLRFMNDCLEFYCKDQSVGSITGFSPLAQPPKGYPHRVMAVPRNSSQGWGTWADRWNEIDWEARNARRIWRETALRRRLNSAGSDRADRLRRQLDGKIDSWSIRFGLSQLIAGNVTIYPAHNRILNIGYDGTGVHSGVGNPKNEQVDFADAGMRPAHVDVDSRVLRAFRRVYSGPWYKSTFRGVRTWLLTRSA